MAEDLQIIVDKFTFIVKSDRMYNEEGVWALAEEDGRVRIGLSDYVQQRSGDVAFAEIQPSGTELAFGDEIAVIETIKVDTAFSSPASGRIVAVNPAMDDAPEVINSDPYGAGWLALIEPADWDADRARLLDHQTYFQRMKAEAEDEVRKS